MHVLTPESKTLKLIDLKLSEITYQRPDTAQIKAQFQSLKQQFSISETVEPQLQLIHQADQLMRQMLDVYSIAEVRHDTNTKDAFYKEESAFMNDAYPIIYQAYCDFFKVVLESKQLPALQAALGDHFFTLNSLALQVQNETLIPYQQKEAKLIQEYQQFFSEATIDYNGQAQTIAAMYAFFESPDRTIRKEAMQAYYAFLDQHHTYLSDLFDKLVQLRQQMAAELGQTNFIPVAYLQRSRSDYDANDVKRFREQVKTHIVPLLKPLEESRQKRLGLEELYYFDSRLTFVSGNARPISDRPLTQVAKKMYSDLSPETATFFEFMQANGRLDLDSRPAKAQGGYNMPFFTHRGSFVLANFNGTAMDVQVLTHELGHAFQTYQSQAIAQEVWQYQAPSSETAEIHSMGMEYLAWDWYPAFFGEDSAKYQYEKITDTIHGFVSCCLVDEFQEFIYQYPKASTAERHQKYKALVRTYYPYKTDAFYQDNEYLKSGKIWQIISHLYFAPFYFIDYALADYCAIQFWQQSRTNFAKTWTRYVELCRLGGSLPFQQVIKKVGLSSPFEEEGVEGLAKMVQNWLEQVDDSAF